MGPHRLIPMGKTSLLRKPPFLSVQKTPRGDVRGNIPDNIHTTSTGGKTLLGCCFETPFTQECLNTYLALSAI